MISFILRLKTHFHSKLKLPRVECRGRLSKRRQRRRARAESVIRHAKIGVVENIETFREKLQVNSLGQTKTAAPTQIKRSKIKSSTRISSNTDRTIVVVCVEVAITSEQHVERQRRSVSKDVAKLKTARQPLEAGVEFYLLLRVAGPDNELGASRFAPSSTPTLNRSTNSPPNQPVPPAKANPTNDSISAVVSGMYGKGPGAL
jgi:hypothetical protein